MQERPSKNMMIGGDDMTLDANTIAIIATAAWAVSEALSLIPAVKANGLFQLLAGIVRKLAGK